MKLIPVYISHVTAANTTEPTRGLCVCGCLFVISGGFLSGSCVLDYIYDREAILAKEVAMPSVFAKKLHFLVNINIEYKRYTKKRFDE